MLRHLGKNSNSQGMSPLKSSNPTTSSSEYSNIAEAQEKKLQIAFMNMIEVPKEEVNKSLKEIYENTNNGRK